MAGPKGNNCRIPYTAGNEHAKCEQFVHLNIEEAILFESIMCQNLL